MIELTVAARDNITLRCDGLCMDYLAPTADLMNEFQEKNREVMATLVTNMGTFGTAAVYMNEEGECQVVNMRESPLKLG